MPLLPLPALWTLLKPCRCLLPPRLLPPPPAGVACGVPVCGSVPQRLPCTAGHPHPVPCIGPDTGLPFERPAGGQVGVWRGDGERGTGCGGGMGRMRWVGHGAWKGWEEPGRGKPQQASWKCGCASNTAKDVTGVASACGAHHAQKQASRPHSHGLSPLTLLSTWCKPCLLLQPLSPPPPRLPLLRYDRVTVLSSGAFIWGTMTAAMAETATLQQVCRVGRGADGMCVCVCIRKGAGRTSVGCMRRGSRDVMGHLTMLRP
jgi:hypothetical protein